MVRRNVIVYAVNNEGQVSKAQVILTVFYIGKFGFNCFECPRRSCDEWGARVWCNHAFDAIADAKTLSVIFYVVQFERPEETVDNLVPVNVPSEFSCVIATKYQLWLVIWIHGHVERKHVLLKYILLDHHIKNRKTNISHFREGETNNGIIARVQEVQLCDQTKGLAFCMDFAIRSSHIEVILAKMTHQFSWTKIYGSFIMEICVSLRVSPVEVVVLLLFLALLAQWGLALWR